MTGGGPGRQTWQWDFLCWITLSVIEGLDTNLVPTHLRIPSPQLIFLSPISFLVTNWNRVNDFCWREIQVTFFSKSYRCRGSVGHTKHYTQGNTSFVSLNGTVSATGVRQYMCSVQRVVEMFCTSAPSSNLHTWHQSVPCCVWAWSNTHPTQETNFVVPERLGATVFR